MSFASFESKLENHQTITYLEVCGLVKMYEYDTASTVQPVIACMGKLYRRLKAGETYNFCDSAGKTCEITQENFREFVQGFFSETMYADAITFEFHEKMRRGKTITCEDVRELADLCEKGDELERGAVINLLHLMLVRLRREDRYPFCDENGKCYAVQIDNFPQFAIRYFGVKAFGEALKDFRDGRYRRFKTGRG